MKKILLIILLFASINFANVEISDGRLEVRSPDSSKITELYRDNDDTFILWIDGVLRLGTGDIHFTGDSNMFWDDANEILFATTFDANFLIVDTIDANFIDVNDLSLGFTIGSIPYSDGSILVENNTDFTWVNATGTLTGADLDISAGTGDYTSTGSGRFDGGLGVGVAPDGTGLKITTTGNTMGVTYTNAILSGSLTAGFTNTITNNAAGATGYGVRNILEGTDSLIGTLTDIQINGPDLVYGHAVTSNAFSSPSDDPTVFQVANYVKWELGATDANMKMWAFYNDSTDPSAVTSGKIFLGHDGVPTIWGTDKDSSLSYNDATGVMDWTTGINITGAGTFSGVLSNGGTVSFAEDIIGTGTGADFFVNAATGDRPILSITGFADSGGGVQKRADLHVDEFGRLVFGGTISGGAFDGVFELLGFFDTGSPRSYLAYVNTALRIGVNSGGGRGAISPMFIAEIKANNTPWFLFTEKDRSLDDFGFNASDTQIKLGVHDGSATLTNIVWLYHDGTDGFLVTDAGDLNIQPTGGGTNITGTLGVTGITTLSSTLDMESNRITDVGSLEFNSATELTISGGAVTVTQGHHSIDTEADAANDDLDTINGGNAGEILLILPKDDNRTVRIRNGVGNIFLKHQVESKSFSFSSPAGSSGVFYVGGYYNWSSTDASLTQASLSVTHSAANSASACHIGIVAGGAGVVDTGVVKLIVTGTTIDDDGNRLGSQTVILVADITTLSTDQYVETSEKWIGQVTIALAIASGSPVNFSLDTNYGCSKYEDFGNQAFTINTLECVGLAGSNDSGFNLRLFHHSSTGWTYAATGFVPGGTVLANMSTDYNPEDELSNGESFAYKRVNLNTDINGDDSEGLILEITTSANKSVEIMDIHFGVHTAPNFSYMATTKQHLIFMKHGSNWLEL